MSFRVGQHNLGRMVKARNNSRQQCTPEKTKIQLSHPFRVFSDVSSNLPASCASLLTELPAKATAGCTLWRQHSEADFSVVLAKLTRVTHRGKVPLRCSAAHPRGAAQSSGVG